MKYVHYSKRCTTLYRNPPRSSRRRGIGLYRHIILCNGTVASRLGVLRTEEWSEVTCPKCLALKSAFGLGVTAEATK